MPPQPIPDRIFIRTSEEELQYCFQFSLIKSITLLKQYQCTHYTSGSQSFWSCDHLRSLQTSRGLPKMDVLRIKFKSNLPKPCLIVLKFSTLLINNMNFLQLKNYGWDFHGKIICKSALRCTEQVVANHESSSFQKTSCLSELKVPLMIHNLT